MSSGECVGKTWKGGNKGRAVGGEGQSEREKFQTAGFYLYRRMNIEKDR